MFSDHDDDDDDFSDIFKRHHDRWWSDMSLTVWLVAGVALAVVLAIILRCCCNKTRGRVLAPPPVDGPAPYPQQQYTAPAPYPAAPPVAVNMVTAPYPVYPPHPAPGAPYPQVPGMYPPHDAPYPAPHYPAGPTAPDAYAFYGVPPPGWTMQACPPSYYQVMGEKQPPYNPNVH